MSYTHILGIDPGKNGALCLLPLAPTDPVLIKMPGTPRDLYDWIQDQCEGWDVLACLELVGGYVGGKGNTGSSMFKFGKGVGHIEVALIACRIPYVEVTPRKWQKHAGITTRLKTESKNEWKNRIKKRAQALFPRLRMTTDQADAVLIAYYGRCSVVVREP